MANIFERVRDYLNQPLPGAPGSKPPAKAGTASKPKTSSSTTKSGSAKTSPPKPDAQQKAPDVQAQLRKREMDLRRAQAKATADERKRLAKERAELEALRRRYETELAAQAQVHAERTEWTHTVVPGDTLSGIAKKYYGNAARWPEIHAANKGQIKNPNLIFPGQVFVIPDKD